MTAEIKPLTVAAPLKHHIIKTKIESIYGSIHRAVFFFSLPCLLSASPDQTFSITYHSAKLLAYTRTHTHTHRRGCFRHFSQSAPRTITRGQPYSHNSLASSALTQRHVLLPSIMSGKLQFPHVSYRELWSALIEYSWYFPRRCYWGPSVETPSAAN